MCDTIVAVGNATKDGSVIFGKNSDREPNEVHAIEYYSRKKNEEETVRTTYITIPQVKETYEVLLLKPFWMWGCEMGSNEFGLTIGNEAVWTKMPYRKIGLLGMDLMRLALERTKTASEALTLITEFLEKYGQGGPGGYTDKKLFYHNSFIIADKKEAWVLETADKFWIAEKVKGVRTISNSITIRKDYDLIHPELIDYAIKKGYCKSEDDFDFAKCFIQKLNINQIGAMGKKRKKRTQCLLEQHMGEITPEIVMSVLRDHNIPPKKEEKWSPHKSSMKSPCLHATSITTPSQSTGSMVSHLKENLQIHWVTGTSAPCTSIFKPIFLPGIGKENEKKAISPTYDPDNLWWLHEKLHRLVLMDYTNRMNIYKHERDELEKQFIHETYEKVNKITRKISKRDQEELRKITKKAFTLSEEKTKSWIEKISKTNPIKNSGFLYKQYWKKQNKAAKLVL
ncbi:MAG: C69 family dipeptidase [Candidatus Heimdallarchaeum endolithica]|uniref:C69 family dipeptidase n=1 Tax=Candidatus Heimdallarchaeum endolithica TaxID=2876572 RepID=A0A9Y1BQA6_9ARCH|nr:MAG: C69 family dipeptidase [Candidatus Heimdallarchaeum endolithica]